MEILFGLFMLVFGLISLQDSFFGAGLRYVTKARDQAIAVNLCERFLNIAAAEFKLGGEMKYGETDLAPELARSDTLRRSLELAGNMHILSIRRFVTPCFPADRLFHITVEMQWSDKPEGGKVEKYSLSTMACIQEKK